MRRTVLEQRIYDIVTPTIENMGYRVVRVRMMDKQGRYTLQIMAERLKDKSMTVDDCAEISHAVSVLLEVEDPIESKYHLEISSPGMDRPLTSLEDFDYYKGFTAKIELDTILDGRRRYRGKLLGIGSSTTMAAETTIDENCNHVFIEVDGAIYSIPIDRIERSKLVLTEELIKAYESGDI